MIFCPYCANMLTVIKGTTEQDAGGNKFGCATCPYEYPIDLHYTERTHLPTKEVDDVLGGKGAWKHVDQADAVCPKCDWEKAYWFQMQIRSADEPMTTFYRCANPSEMCGHNWRE